MISASGKRVILWVTAALGLVASVTAHGHGDNLEQPSHSQPSSMKSVDETYHRHARFSVWIFAHIALMSFAWIFILPISAFSFRDT